MKAVNLLALREQTREQHQAAEAMLPLMDAGLTRQRYGQILQWFYNVVAGWESWCGQHAPSHLTEMVRGRRRSPLMLSDLHSLGLTPLAGEPSRPGALDAQMAGLEPGSPEYEAGFLGAMYVMEGSTLGGQYIARHVEATLGLAPGEGDAYFRGYGVETGARWNAFRELLRAVPDEHTAQAISAAKATFAYVEEAMCCCPAVLDAAHALL